MNAYTRAIAHEFWLCNTNTVLKTDFISIYQKSRGTVSTPENVKSALREAGLRPHNPSIVLQKLQNNCTEKAPERQLSPPSMAHDEN